MSIIYDALQKTQRQLDNKHDMNVVINRDANSWKLKLFCIALIAFSLSVVSIYWESYKHLILSIPKMINKPQVQTQNLKKQDIIKNAVKADAKTLPPAGFPVATAASSSLPKGYPGLNLQGVFVSDHEKIAIINNQFLHVGDMIGAKKIISIEFNEVKLQEGENVIRL